MFEKLKAWWNKPLPTQEGKKYTETTAMSVGPPPLPAGADLIEEEAWSGFSGYVSSAEQVRERRRNDIETFAKLAANLSVTTHVSPGEALEMIRKAGNFASREELDRLILENAELRRAFETGYGEHESRLPDCPARTSPILSGDDVEIVLLVRGDIIRGVDGRPDRQAVEMLIHGPKLSQPTTIRWVNVLPVQPLSFTFGASKGSHHPYELTLGSNTKGKPPVVLSDSNVGLHDGEDIDIEINTLPRVSPPPPPEPKPPAEAVVEDRKPMPEPPPVELSDGTTCSLTDLRKERKGEESPAARSVSSLCELFDAVRAFRFYHGPHCPQSGCTCGLDRIKAALKALDENR